MHRISKPIIIATIAFVVLAGAAIAQTYTQVVNLTAGQTALITCDGANRLRAARQSDLIIALACGRPAEPTPTPTEPAPAPTATPTEPAPPASDTMTRCHAEPMAHDGLNVHEHGDCAPDWADAWSIAQFGHPVIWGGDEATPNENAMKHQAYKGFTARMSGVDLYIRHHSQSNPHGRSAPFHSYEVYARDGSGNVSFWQGHQWYGYPEFRSQRMTRRHEVPGTDGFPGRDQFIISAPDRTDWNNYLRCEQWYGFGGLWSWDLSITICGASTFFSYDEHLGDIANPDTWDRTGSLGLSRRIEATHYGPDNPLVGGVRVPLDQWYCASAQPIEDRTEYGRPEWTLSGPVAGPNDCPSGQLPQYKASTFPRAGVYFQTGNTAEKTFNGAGVTLPN